MSEFSTLQRQETTIPSEVDTHPDLIEPKSKYCQIGDFNFQYPESRYSYLTIPSERCQKDTETIPLKLDSSFMSTKTTH